ncbi:MAG TPA: GNAT family protein [Acidimicrobiales bacterium]|nr:GNAT family protein [Acidimicrobiales bacterium]
MLRGERVTLRVMTADDVDAVTAVLTDSHVAARWPRYDRVRVEAEMVTDSENGQTVYVVEVEAAVVGVIQSHEEDDPEYRQASIDIALLPSASDRGLGTDAVRTLARHLVESGHHHLTIDPAADNARAIACYRKVGFRDVGILRRNEMGPDGTFHDALLMDLLPEDLG